LIYKIRVENGKETFCPFSEKKETKSQKRKRKLYFAKKERKWNILNRNGRGNGGVVFDGNGNGKKILEK
jgi:hypothetical protein